MKVELKETNEKVQIEIGDMLIGSDDKCYLVCEVTDDEFPINLIDLSNMTHANGFISLSQLNTQHYIKRAIPIKRIIKHDNLTIKEEY